MSITFPKTQAARLDFLMRTFLPTDVTAEKTTERGLSTIAKLNRDFRGSAAAALNPNLGDISDLVADAVTDAHNACVALVQSANLDQIAALDAAKQRKLVSADFNRGEEQASNFHFEGVIVEAYRGTNESYTKHIQLKKAQESDVGEPDALLAQWEKENA